MPPDERRVAWLRDGAANDVQRAVGTRGGEWRTAIDGSAVNAWHLTKLGEEPLDEGWRRRRAVLRLGWTKRERDDVAWVDAEWFATKACGRREHEAPAGKQHERERDLDGNRRAAHGKPRCAADAR